MLAGLLTLFMLGIAGLVVITVVMAVVGVVFSLTLGLAGVLLFKVLPILLVGWIVLKILSRGRSPARISAADREWLDG